MGLLSGIIGNASNVSVEEVMKEWGFIFSENENLVAAYKLVRDYILFTPNRLVIIDIQGLTGKKVEIQSIPYVHITRFSVENAGHFDLDAELKIWIASHPVPIKKTFNRSANIYEVQRILADAITGA